MSSDASARSPWTGLSQFLPTTQKILQFSNKEGPKATDKIVYVAGAFDLFHVGHLDFLEKAKALGTYLIVGLHTDPVVNRSAYCWIIDNQKQCTGSGAGSVGFVCYCAPRIRIRKSVIIRNSVPEPDS
jgi:cytidyltransferase-like protein